MVGEEACRYYKIGRFRCDGSSRVKISIDTIIDFSMVGFRRSSPQPLSYMLLLSNRHHNSRMQVINESRMLMAVNFEEFDLSMCMDVFAQSTASTKPDEPEEIVFANILAGTFLDRIFSDASRPDDPKEPATIRRGRRLRKNTAAIFCEPEEDDVDYEDLTSTSCDVVMSSDSSEESESEDEDIFREESCSSDDSWDDETNSCIPTYSGGIRSSGTSRHETNDDSSGIGLDAGGEIDDDTESDDDDVIFCDDDVIFCDDDVIFCNDATSDFKHKTQILKKVRFKSHADFFEVDTRWSDSDLMDARRGPWEENARDRSRFGRRIEETEGGISWVLEPQHRKRVAEIICRWIGSTTP